MSIVPKTADPSAGSAVDADRRVDTSLEIRRLERAAISLISAFPGASYLGSDDLTRSLSRSMGFASADLAFLRVEFGDRRMTLICVPSRIWHSTSRLISLRRLAMKAGRSPVLVPAGFLLRQPRLQTATAMGSADGIEVTAQHRIAVLMHLVERDGASTLLETACAVDHHSPISLVLTMAALGLVRIDLDQELTSDTPVLLRQAGA